jgi:phenylpropionate dioxygenase-like ring-hydroxylating dioxygenase large terminal subunit
MSGLADDATVVQRILDHVDRGSTDLCETTWREPVEHYRSPERLRREIELVLRRQPTPFCPSPALPGAGSYLARDAAGTPLLAVRGDDGRVRVFRNACRHRGTPLASGSGCARAFPCPYHGWTYALDGRLRHVPHEHGFPGLDKGARGLVPVAAVERGGLVFVTQEPAGSGEPEPPEMPELVAPGQRLLQTGEREVAANWKILLEGFLEGYHIRATHPGTFYPLQYDNLNVVERFGKNSRVAFPYRAVEKLRALPPAQRSAAGKLTYVYHLFPNVMLATFPEYLFMVVLEPLAVDRSSLFTYVMTSRPEPEGEERLGPRRGGDLVDAGGAEDRAVACAIQRGLASGANECFEFGRFEGAIGHFHRTLHAALDAAVAACAG